MKSLKLAFLAVGFISATSSTLRAQDCPLGRSERITDDFRFIASSDQGAVGDVVAVDVSVVAENPRTDLLGLQVIGCYDPLVAELLDQPQYSAAFDELSSLATFSKRSQNGSEGFSLSVSFNSRRSPRYFPTREPLRLATLFFRLRGTPGDSFAVAFCDNAFRLPHGPCRKNFLGYNETLTQPFLTALSTRHVSGRVVVTDGPATRPNPPPLPPLAKTYPEEPTAETAQIHFELTGAVARPGARAVAVDLHVTSNFEFSGFALSVTFPPRYLELARIEEHNRPGAVRIDNQRGGLGMFMVDSRRRVGAEGERVKLVTLYFNVKAEAGEVSQVTPAFEELNGFINWLAILYQNNQLSPDPLPLTAQVSPLIVEDGLLMIQREPTFRGDVNLDYTLDLTDAVVLLRDLFLGEEGIACEAAADFNEDTKVNISDPIGILQHLFLGGPPSTVSQDVFCD